MVIRATVLSSFTPGKGKRLGLMEPIERQILPSPPRTLGQSEPEALPGVCVTAALGK